MSGRSRANRLAGETSPYLLQHAHNPVEWYPWGPQAFEEARRRDVPIFLSVGYSTCYWCHVMERESFEDEAIGRAMSERFVCVKVDREERPDVDDLAMAATQITTGRGGWPMSVFLEPQGLRPFWCGTYFPPEPRMGMPGFVQVLDAVAGAWRERRDEVVKQSERLAELVRRHLGERRAPVGVGVGQVTRCVQGLLASLDRTNGGFGGAPKFPQPVFLELLLDARGSAGDEGTASAIDRALRLTLDQMACGGIRDHVGGGFHRYSVDAAWTVPHFEKMLYDNAQLLEVYARAGEVYDDDFYRLVARETAEYVLREIDTPEGGFASAQDAEVDGREGKNYLWTPEEVRAALGKGGEDDAAFALRVYGLDAGPNFRDPHHPDEPPSNVLRLEDRPERIAERMGVGVDELCERLGRVNAALYAARAGRKQPRLDDKVLTSWNGLLIGALASAGGMMAQPRYIDAARRGAEFILMRHRGADGLLRTSRAGAAKTPGFLEDYAFLIHGLLALADREAPGDGEALGRAVDLADEAEGLFGAGEGGVGGGGGGGVGGGGGYYDTRAGRGEGAELFVRTSGVHDGAVPSGQSVMLGNLIRLHAATGEQRWLDRAIGCLASLSAAIAESPTSTANAARWLLRLLLAGPEVSARIAAIAPIAPSGGGAPAREERTPVEVYADRERVEVGPDSPAELRLVLSIAEGFHINAAQPGDPALVPLRVHVVNGTGIAAYADYPEGEAYGPEGKVRVHRGEVEVRIAVEASGEWRGRPLLAVTFQACTHSECLAPMTVELDVAVDPVE